MLVKNASLLPPNNVATDREVFIPRFYIICDRIYQSGSIGSSTADTAKSEYVEFMSAGVKLHIDQFAMFNHQKDLDVFLGQYLHKNGKFKNIYTVCIHVLFCLKVRLIWNKVLISAKTM